MDYFLLGDFDFLYSYLFRVHFITDIIPGALSGLLFGYLVYLLYHYIRPKLIPADSGYVRGHLLGYPETLDHLCDLVDHPFNSPI